MSEVYVLGHVSKATGKLLARMAEKRDYLSQYIDHLEGAPEDEPGGSR